MTIDKKRDQLNQILKKYKFDFTSKDDPNVDFHYVINKAFGTNLGIDIVKSTKSPLAIVGLAIGINLEHRQGFEKLSKEKKRDFIFELQEKLLGMNLDFGFQPNPQNLEIIQISEVMVLEELSEGLVISILRKVRNGGLYVMWKFQNEFSSKIGNSENISIYK